MSVQFRFVFLLKIRINTFKEVIYFKQNSNNDDKIYMYT